MAETSMIPRKNGGEVERVEQASSRPVYMPRTDIYETKEGFVLLADLPGVDEASLQVSLEKNVLTIHASPTQRSLEGYTPAYQEYGIGDFHRTFRLSEEVDSGRIEATIKDGVLRLVLPRSQQVSRKISVRSS